MKNTIPSRIMRAAAVAAVVCGIASSALAQTTPTDYVSILESYNPILYFPLNDSNTPYGEMFTNIGTAGNWGEGIVIAAMNLQQQSLLPGDPNMGAQFTGSSSYFVVPISPEINPSYQNYTANNANPAAPFTVEMWVE